MPNDLTMRSVLDDDRGFLLELYATTREDLLATPLSDDEKRLLIERQYEAQRAHYEAHFPDAEHSIVEVEGNPVGRVWIDRRDDEIRLLDIIVSPEHQNHGIGSQVMDRLIAESESVGKVLRHTVQVGNDGALRFYERFGFEVIDESAVYWLMERPV